MTKDALMALRNPCTIRVWLGGSFDPIHNGHLAMIEHVYRVLALACPHHTIIANLLPTSGSPLKDHPTPNEHRLAMLELAIKDLPFLSIDTTELNQPPPVYTFNTFLKFHEYFADDILIFIMGADSILQLDQWYRSFELLHLTNLWVLPRPALTTDFSFSHCTSAQVNLTNQLDNSIKNLVVKSPKDLINKPSNHIYIDEFSPANIASRQLRCWLHSNVYEENQKAKQCLPAKVYEYIINHGLYLN